MLPGMRMGGGYRTLDEKRLDEISFAVTTIQVAELELCMAMIGLLAAGNKITRKNIKTLVFLTRKK